MRLTADTITDDNIRALRRDGDLSSMWQREIAIALGEVTTVNHPARDHREARARCADLLNTRAQDHCIARRHNGHVRDVCEGQCCTSCGGPIDENEECRC